MVSDLINDPSADYGDYGNTLSDAQLGISPGLISTTDPAYQAMLAGGTASSPAQSNSFGSQLFGWASLGATIAKTVIGANNSNTRIVPKPKTVGATVLTGNTGMLLGLGLVVILAIAFASRK